MKKALIILGLTVVLSLALVGIASANNGPHGGYTNLTDACASCHRAHTGVGPPLLVAQSIYDVCTSCHGSGGTGANTDVLDGMYINGRNSSAGQGGGMLNGGGFLYMGGAAPANPSDVVINGGTGAQASTSAHNVEGLPNPVGTTFGETGKSDGRTAPAWGGGLAVGLSWNGSWTAPMTLDPTTQPNATLECTSCHSPHGGANYRILTSPNFGSSTSNGSDGDFGGLKAGTWVNGVWNTSYATVISTPSDTGSARYSNWSQTITPGTGGPWLAANYTVGMNTWCAACHQRYNTATHTAAAKNNSSAYNANLYVLPPTIAAGDARQTSQFPDYLSSVTDGYDAGDGNGSMPRYRHTVGTQLSTQATNKGGAPYLPMRVAATDGWKENSTSGNRDYNNAPYTDGQPNPVPAAENTYVTCLTCHYAHGTTAVMQGFATKTIQMINGVPIRVDNPSGPGVAPESDSALLFYDNRGVCESCHKKSQVKFNNY